MRAKILLLASLAMFVACDRSTPTFQPSATTAFPVPDAATLSPPLVADQVVIARFEGRSLTCRGFFRIAAERSDLVCLDALGHRMLALEWAGTEVTLTSAPPGMDLPGKAIAAEIAAIYAPRAALAALYQDAGLSVIDTATARQVTTAGRPVLEIHYDPDFRHRWSGRAQLFNRMTGHSIEVRSRRIDR